MIRSRGQQISLPYMPGWIFKGSSKDSEELRISVPYSPEIWPSDLYKTRNAPLKWKCVTFGRFRYLFSLLGSAIVQFLV